jgi:hypothetical protein
MSIGGH